MTGRRATLAAAALTALAASLPFARGVLSGGTFYFRDLGRHFLPLRRFLAEGLRQGELRWWNPYVHEGAPAALPPLGHPLELLQALWPDERGLTVLLALHVPLAALACFALARGLGLGRTAAAVAGLGYALGGFALSCLNLYVYLHALACAPLAVLGLQRAAAGTAAGTGLGALGVALCLATSGAEIAAQAVLLGAVLALAHRWRELAAWLRLAAATGLGAALAAVPLAFMAAQVAGSARQRGFPAEVTLGHSVHPLTFLQVVIGALYGEPWRIAERWWGQNFFPRGFPYILSLYLGAIIVTLAVVGAVHAGRRGRVLAAMAALGALVCLGRWAGLQPLVEQAEVLRRFRFPVKAFFTVHAAAALLAAAAVDQLADGRRAAWRLYAVLAGAAGLALVLVPLLPRLARGATRWFMAGFFPPDMGWSDRSERLAVIAADARAAGALALCAAALAAAVLARRLRAPAAAALLALLAGADLLRSGAGLNPMIDPEALRPAPEVRALAAAWRSGGQRVFTCDLEDSPAYYRGRALRGESHEVWSTLTLVDTLTPSFNVPLGVPSAYSPDLTMLVPLQRVLEPAEGCRDVAALTGRLRAAGVAHVVSLEPLAAPGLALEHVLAVPRLGPLSVHVYRLAHASPLREVRGARVLDARERPGRLELSVEAARPGDWIVREAYAPGWRAEVDGREAALTVREGWHMAVAIPAGARRVVLAYRPPGLGLAAAVSAAAAVAVISLMVPSVWARRRRRARSAPG